MVVFPYTRKYHYTNQTTYAVKDLEPNTGYQFRVIVIKLNKSSPYSNWSNVITTRKICKKRSCGVTNIRLELTSRKPYQKNEELKAKFNWKPALLSERDKTQLKYITEELSSLMRNGNCYPGKYPTKDSHSAITSNSSDENQQVYYDCWYELKMAAVDDYFWSTAVAGERTRIFHVPSKYR
ncbi:---NA--- [Paramuricea clavata]|uniref:---NA n=1 Tax=Paramuricea clavata TaxID=317549 RepID=A0A7D9L1Y9_PARCT|nr:---NA--- [Paramuricea clavata]